MNPRDTLHGLYAITDAAWTPVQTLLSQVEAALKGGVRIVQLREKSQSDTALLPLARSLVALCHRYGALCLIDDRIALTVESGADGIHIGKEDTPLPEARRLLPSAIIGVSCYDTLDLGIAAQNGGADYVAFGAFFPTAIKPDAPHPPPTLIREARQRLDIPVCVIGGISLETLPGLIPYGPDMAAVISGLWNAPCIETRTRELAHCFNPGVVQ